MAFARSWWLMCVLGSVSVVGCTEGSGGGGGSGTGGDGGSGGTTGLKHPCTEQGIRDAIAQGGGPHTFDCNGPTTVRTDEEIGVDRNCVLDGGGNLTVDGNDDHRVFGVADGVTAELRGMTIRGGLGGDGPGGLSNPRGNVTLRQVTIVANDCTGGLFPCESGSGVENGGQMTFYNCVITENRSGGIRNDGTMTLVSTTVSDNEREGIFTRGPLTLVESTVSNHGFAGIGADDTSVVLINSTVSGNDMTNSAGSVMLVNSTVLGKVGGLSADGRLTVSGSVIVGTCEGNTVASLGHNIESSANTCDFSQSTDQVDVSADDLKLGELADNGGPTQTHALGEDSVAIDQIPVEECVDADGEPLTTDQRGFTRPARDRCDVGSFEVQARDSFLALYCDAVAECFETDHYRVKSCDVDGALIRDVLSLEEVADPNACDFAKERFFECAVSAGCHKLIDPEKVIGECADPEDLSACFAPAE